MLFTRFTRLVLVSVFAVATPSVSVVQCTHLGDIHNISELFQDYLEAGADFVETNTFNGTPVSQSDYGTQELVG